jgi:hypothetical protein
MAAAFKQGLKESGYADGQNGCRPFARRPPPLSLTPPKIPNPGRRKPAGSSYC